jgi:hypothetical protein
VSGSHRAPERGGPTGRLLSWVERRAARLAERDEADRAAGRARRVPPPRPNPQRTRVRFPRWYSTGRGQLLIAGGAVALAVVLRVLVPGGSAEEPGTPLGSGLPRYGADWTAAHGTKYRISVTPLAQLSSRASGDGCVRTPSDGFVNARFGVRVENLSGTDAPVPRVDFGANLDASGSAVPTMVDLPRVRTNVAVTPRSRGTTCSAASSIAPSAGPSMKKDQVLDFVGTVGGISIPVEPGLSVIVRYVGKSGAQELLAPFPAFPVGS